MPDSPGIPWEHIRLILFDLDGTLLETKPSSQQALLARLDELGHAYSAEGRKEAILWTLSYFAGPLRSKADYQKYGREGFWKHYVRSFLKNLGAQGDSIDELVDEIVPWFVNSQRPASALLDGGADMLRGLRESGYALGVITNRNEPLTGELLDLKILPEFQFSLAAGQIECWKPDPRLFEVALEMAGGVAPAEAVYIGDNYYADAIGAQKARLHSVLIDTFGVYEDYRSQSVVVKSLVAFAETIPDRGQHQPDR